MYLRGSGVIVRSSRPASFEPAGIDAAALPISVRLHLGSTFPARTASRW